MSETLAEVARSARSRPSLNIPTYDAIASGSRVLRVLALLVLVGALPLFAYSFIAGDQLHKAWVEREHVENDLLSAETQKPDPLALTGLQQQAHSAQWQVESTALSCIGSFAAGLLLLGLVAVLRMVAFIALAVRDGARNTFHLQALRN